jgi:hypothetical protein
VLRALDTPPRERQTPATLANSKWSGMHYEACVRALARIGHAQGLAGHPWHQLPADCRRALAKLWASESSSEEIIAEFKSEYRALALHPHSTSWVKIHSIRTASRKLKEIGFSFGEARLMVGAAVVEVEAAIAQDANAAVVKAREAHRATCRSMLRDGKCPRPSNCTCDPSTVAQAKTKVGSVECPHCHWGFAPSAILNHIREKHGEIR